MKKEYINPQMKVYGMESEEPLLSVSDLNVNNVNPNVIDDEDAEEDSWAKGYSW